jgi:predicted amidohydrolase YtcJ
MISVLPPFFIYRRLRYNGGMSDLLITNAHIITLDTSKPYAKSMLVRNSRIAAFDEAIPDDCDVPTHDLGGLTVVPGFIDSHVHFVWTGVRHWALDLRNALTVADVQAQVREWAQKLPDNHIILGLGLDNEDFPGPLPTATDLHTVAPNHPVLLQGITGHLTVANYCAMHLFGLGPHLDGWHANGTLVGAAHTAIAWRGPTLFAEQIGWQKVFGSAAAEAASVGITTLHALEGDDGADDAGVRALLKHGPMLPVRTVLYWQTTHVDAVQALGLPRIGGCIWVDGDFGPHTAALKHPYADYPCTCGQLYISDERLQSFVNRANAAGLQIALHCVGDAAVEQVLRAYRQALQQHPRTDHRHRIEHFEIYDDDLLRDAKAAGVSVAIQPAFDGYFGGMEHSQRYLGSERAQRADAIATFDRHGIPIGGGSDSTVTPLGPIFGMHCAVNHSNPSERVFIERALRLWTIDNAKLAFEEHDKGTLEVGKLADFVILDRDPLATPADMIKDIKVRRTVMGGMITYESEDNND